MIGYKCMITGLRLQGATLLELNISEGSVPLYSQVHGGLQFPNCMSTFQCGEEHGVQSQSDRPPHY